ncbi:MAG TPA: DUF5615 family PIN-like protein [Ktedonobacteraceae bacterium]|nr:DUF5615 family PIN-like protein [Ktedonobacteraceae bacterium]
MKILADENISARLVERLRQEGHEVEYISEIARGSKDSTVLDIANKQGALLITDDKDFGELVFHQHLKASGVLLIRLASLSPPEEIEIVTRVIKTYGDRLLQSFSVIMPRGVRIRPA